MNADSLEGKGWKAMRPLIEKEKCDGCWKCLDICPSGAIMKVEGKAYITTECVECGACVPECPVGAIVYEEVFTT